jgi:hypothetical protein
VDPDADNESDSDGDEDWQYIRVEPSKGETCDQLLPQRQAEQLPLPVDTEEEKQDEPKPVPEEERTSQQQNQKEEPSDQLGQFNNAFELSSQVERKPSLEDEPEEFGDKLEECKLAEEAFTSEVKLTIGELAQETAAFNEVKPKVEEVLQQGGDLQKFGGEEHFLAAGQQKEAEVADVFGEKQVPSNLDLEVCHLI